MLRHKQKLKYMVLILMYFTCFTLHAYMLSDFYDKNKFKTDFCTALLIFSW